MRESKISILLLITLITLNVILFFNCHIRLNSDCFSDCTRTKNDDGSSIGKTCYQNTCEVRKFMDDETKTTGTNNNCNCSIF